MLFGRQHFIYYCFTFFIFFSPQDRACLLQEQYLAMASKIKQEASPATGLMYPDGLLTPPASSRKPLDCIDEDEPNHHVHNVITNESRDINK